MSEELKVSGADTGKKPIYKKVWFWAVIVFAVICVSAAGASSNKNTGETSDRQGGSTSQDNNQDNNTSTASNSNSGDNISTEYKNALKKAESYSKTMHMSKQGIYDQLTSEYGEKFPADAAQYAIDNLKADYKANALAKAKNYQGAMSMSSSAIYDQLISDYGEKFTTEEAQYAIDHLND